MTPAGYLLMPGRVPLRRCRTCGVEMAGPSHVHICVEPERVPVFDLRPGRAPFAPRFREAAEP